MTCCRACLRMRWPTLRRPTRPEGQMASRQPPPWRQRASAACTSTTRTPRLSCKPRRSVRATAGMAQRPHHSTALTVRQPTAGRGLTNRTPAPQQPSRRPSRNCPRAPSMLVHTRPHTSSLRRRQGWASAGGMTAAVGLACHQHRHLHAPFQSPPLLTSSRQGTRLRLGMHRAAACCTTHLTSRSPCVAPSPRSIGKTASGCTLWRCRRRSCACMSTSLAPEYRQGEALMYRTPDGRETPVVAIATDSAYWRPSYQIRLPSGQEVSVTDEVLTPAQQPPQQSAEQPPVGQAAHVSLAGPPPAPAPLPSQTSDQQHPAVPPNFQPADASYPRFGSQPPPTRPPPLASPPRQPQQAPPPADNAAYTPAPGFKPALTAVTEAQKCAKYAVSSLGFEDVPTAVRYLQDALRLLTQPP